MKSMANRTHGSMGLVMAIALFLLSACTGTAEPPPPPSETSGRASTPVHVLITVPFDEVAPAALARYLAQWTQSGVVADVTRLDREGAEAGELSTLVILDFVDEGSYEAWDAQNASSLANQVTVRRADLYVSGGTHSDDRAGSHYLVHIHGVPDTPEGQKEYEGFLDGYMVPLLEGQRDADILRGYRLYIERNPGGGMGRSIWAAQYRDRDAYELTGPIKRKIREDLIANDPTFARYREIYKGLREPLAFYPADYIEVPGQAEPVTE